ADGPLTVISVVPEVRAEAGTALEDLPLATFADADFGGQDSDFTATIDWGDGTPLAQGDVWSEADGTFLGTGSHPYAADGRFPILILIGDEAGTADHVFDPDNPDDAGSYTVAVSQATILNSDLEVTAHDLGGMATLSTGSVLVATLDDADEDGRDTQVSIAWG